MKERGFVKNPQEAAKKEQNAKCDTPTPLKWELKFEKSTPLLRQEVTKDEYAYAPYRVICFSVQEAGDKKIKFSTKHQGGGYSKAYYVLPTFYLFNQKSEPIHINKNFSIRQEAWTGDYIFEGMLSFKKNEIYYLVIESDNRHPTSPWSKYPNYGMGAAASLFPIDVYTSVFGMVNVEINP